jgi:hypothetical protein
MRFAYADPPYVGQAKRHYGDQPSYAGEVDHAGLVARLVAEYPDGWALSLSARSLPLVLTMCPADVLVLAWVKPIAPPMGDHRVYSWEPVVLRGGRRPEGYVRTHLIASPPQFTFRPRPEGHVIGEKPAEFCRWVFACLGARPGDALDDLYPGSGAVTRAWEQYTAQLRLPLGA